MWLCAREGAIVNGNEEREEESAAAETDGTGDEGNDSDTLDCEEEVSDIEEEEDLDTGFEVLTELHALFQKSRDAFRSKGIICQIFQ